MKREACCVLRVPCSVFREGSRLRLRLGSEGEGKIKIRIKVTIRTGIRMGRKFPEKFLALRP